MYMITVGIDVSKDRPPSHPGGGESRPNTTRQKLLGQPLR